MTQILGPLQPRHTFEKLPVILRARFIPDQEFFGCHRFLPGRCHGKYLTSPMGGGKQPDLVTQLILNPDCYNPRAHLPACAGFG